MPLDHGYGVAAGTFASFTREDPSDFGHWYHGKLRINTPTGPYEAALDVDTPSGVGVSYRLVTGLRTGHIPAIAGLPNGFNELPRTAGSGAMDYVRSTILQDRWVIRWTVRWRWLRIPRLRWLHHPWIASDGDNALNVLEPLLHAAARIYIFGEPYTSGLGVHNVHLNQGDPPGPHQAEDGSWQDGLVMIQSTAGALNAWQVKFNTQSLHTDDAGLPLP